MSDLPERCEVPFYGAPSDPPEACGTPRPCSLHDCSCTPCTTPQHGAPGYAHCAACCYGSLIAEYDHGCPVDGHAEMAVRQFGPLAEGVAVPSPADSQF